MTAHAVVRQVVPADVVTVFDLVPDHGRRLERDTLLRSAGTIDDVPPGVGVESVCPHHTHRPPPARLVEPLAPAGFRFGTRRRFARAGGVPVVGMIGRIEKTVLDCPDPRGLAAFYAELLGMRVNEDDGDGAWVVIGRDERWRELAFQRADPYVAPGWPDPERPQQEHLDIRVDDVASAEREVLRLGATPLAGEQGTGFRVYADPAGHPFCLVY